MEITTAQGAPGEMVTIEEYVGASELETELDWGRLNTFRAANMLLDKPDLLEPVPRAWLESVARFVAGEGL